VIHKRENIKMTTKCTYPGCKEPAEASWRFECVNKKDTAVELPLCKYHLHVCMGNHFDVLLNAEEPKSPEDWMIVLKDSARTIDAVELIEQVIAARELIRIAKSTT